jgi:chromosome segregation ATPase
MESVLSEIRQLRQDLRTAAVATRKAQIVIYRLHVQQGAVERAANRLETVKNSLAEAESQKKYQMQEIKRIEELRDKTTIETQRKQLETYLSQLQENLQVPDPQEQELQAKQTELETELRAEQAKLDRLQEELDRLENSLETTALQASSRQP